MNIIFLTTSIFDKQTGGTIYNKNLIKFLQLHYTNVSVNLINSLNKYKFNFNSVYIIDGILIHSTVRLHRLIEYKIIFIIHSLFSELNCFSLNNKKIFKKIENIIFQNFTVIFPKNIPPSDKYKNVVTIEPGINKRWQTKLSHSRLPKKILYLANFNKNKNQLFFLKVFKLLNNKDITVDFWGDIDDIEYFNNCLNFIKDNSLNNVQYKGIINNLKVNKLMISYDLFCLFSKYENNSMGVIEAIACKLPILISPTGNYKEYIKKNILGILKNFNILDTYHYFSNIIENPFTYKSHIDSLLNFKINQWQKNFIPLLKVIQNV